MIAQPGGAERPAGLGDLDDAVGDVGDLGLGGAVGQAHVGVDALGGEVPLGELRVLAGDAHALRQILDSLHRRVGGHGSDDQDRVRRGLAVAQLAEADDVAGGLLHPVATGEAEVEQAFGDVHRDLLRTQDAHVGDARVVDGRLVVDRRRPHAPAGRPPRTARASPSPTIPWAAPASARAAGYPGAGQCAVGVSSRSRTA